MLEKYTKRKENAVFKRKKTKYIHTIDENILFINNY